MRPHWLPLLLVGLGGCGLFDFNADAGTTGDGGAVDAAASGYGRPTLEVTIAGVHFGPSAPDPGSRADLVTQRDAFSGRVTSSSFGVSASSAATGAACSIGVRAAGDGVAPIGVGAYRLSGSSLGGTAPGSVAPIAVEGVAVPQGQWQCSGSGCDGGVFVLTALDAAHAEGFLAGRFGSVSGGLAADVVCSFYVPVVTYAP